MAAADKLPSLGGGRQR